VVATLLLSLVIGVVIGLLGAGGSILTVPVLVFVGGAEPHAAVLVSLVVVGVTSLLTSLWQARLGHVRFPVAALFAAVGVPGTWFGAWLARSWSGRTTLLFFAAVMAVAGGATLLRRHSDGGDRKLHGLGYLVLAVLGFAVGTVTGTVGAGGGFLIVPALVLVAGMPLRDAIGTSLLVIAVNCGSGVWSKWSSAPLDLRLAALVTGATLVGAVVGSLVGRKLSVESLKRGFGVLLLLVAAWVGWRGWHERATPPSAGTSASGAR